MQRVLIVKSAFGGHSRGSKITNPKEIAAVLSGENAHHVIQSDHPEEAMSVPAFEDTNEEE